MEEELHTLVVDGLLACIDDTLKHQVGLFKLIPEEEIGLRELYLHGVALGKVGAQHIEAAEHPAAPRGLLVCNRLARRLYIKIGIKRARANTVLCQRINAISSNGIGYSLIGRR